MRYHERYLNGRESMTIFYVEDVRKEDVKPLKASLEEIGRTVQVCPTSSGTNCYQPKLRRLRVSHNIPFGRDIENIKIQKELLRNYTRT
jgi:hypothetical protein